MAPGSGRVPQIEAPDDGNVSSHGNEGQDGQAANMPMPPVMPND